MTAVVVITPPEPLVEFSEAKVWAPVFAGDEDMRVKHLLAGAQAAIEPPRSWVGVAFGRQTLELRLDGFGCGTVPLPYGPVASVEEVSYRDADGVDRTLAEGDDFELIHGGSVSAAVRPATGKAWPRWGGGRVSVRIRYRAGFERDDPAIEPVKQAIVLGAIRLRALGEQDLSLRSEEIPGVETRTYTVSDAAASLVRRAVDDLLNPFRVFAL